MYSSQCLRHTHFEHNKLFNNHSKIFDTKASRYEANILWLFQKRCVTFSNFVTLQDHWVTSDPKFSKCYNFSSVHWNQSKLLLKYLIDESHLYLIRNYFVIFPCHPVMQNMSKPFFDLKNNIQLMINRYVVMHEMSKMIQVYSPKRSQNNFHYCHRYLTTSWQVSWSPVTNGSGRVNK